MHITYWQERKIVTGRRVDLLGLENLPRSAFTPHLLGKRAGQVSLPKQTRICFESGKKILLDSDLRILLYLISLLVVKQFRERIIPMGQLLGDERGCNDYRTL